MDVSNALYCHNIFSGLWNVFKSVRSMYPHYRCCTYDKATVWT